MSGAIGEVNNEPDWEPINAIPTSTALQSTRVDSVDETEVTEERAIVTRVTNSGDAVAADELIDARPRFRALTATTNVNQTTDQTDLTARQRALLSLDLAAEKLDQADGAGAATTLENAARQARDDARRLNTNSPEARFLTAFAENAEAR